MSTRIISATVLVLASSAASHVFLRSEQSPVLRHPLSPAWVVRIAPRTVWDSVYSEEQAARGEALFKDKCSRCHGEAMQGIDDAPPLAGKEFMIGWVGKSVGALFERINSSMPSDDPGTLSKAQIGDAVAYILKFSAFPAGKTDLPTDGDALKEIQIVGAKP
ncbi:MAG: c-type cytochrome [Gemmatimonadales bacterium]